MATTKSFTSSYVGEASSEYFLKSVFKSHIADLKGVKVLSNITKAEKLRKFDASNIIQSDSGATCDFNATGTYTISEVSLAPARQKVNAEFCYKDFLDLWNNGSMGAGVGHGDVPADFESGLINLIGNLTAKGIDKNMALGSATGLTGVDTAITGLAPQAKAGTGSGQKVAGDTLSKANIEAALESMQNALPDGLAGKAPSELVFLVSPKALRFHKQALSAQGFNTSAEEQKDTFAGIEVVAIDGLTARPDVMLLQERTNIAIGYDLKDNASEVSIIDMRLTTGDDKIRVKVNFAYDIKYIFPDEVVIYNPELV